MQEAREGGMLPDRWFPDTLSAYSVCRLQLKEEGRGPGRGKGKGHQWPTPGEKGGEEGRGG